MMFVKMTGLPTYILLLSFPKKWYKDTSYLSFGLSAFEVSTCIACRHSYSERIFSAMKIVKTQLRNRMGDEYMNHSLICYVEKEKMLKVTNDVAVDRFRKSGNRKY